MEESCEQTVIHIQSNWCNLFYPFKHKNITVKKHRNKEISNYIKQNVTYYTKAAPTVIKPFSENPGFLLATDVSNPVLPLVAVCDPAQAAPQDDLHLTPDLSHLPTGPGPGVPPHLLQD